MINGKFISSSLKETQEIGSGVAKKLKKGDIVFLSGILGAGKTELIRGIAKGLGIKSKITSPTFNILRTYEIPQGGEFYHFDCYRLKKYTDLIELGWEEILADPEAVIVLEWPECLVDKDIINTIDGRSLRVKIEVERDKRIINIKAQNLN